MIALHLLRHAKSSWDDPGTPDAERGLAPRGRRAVAALRAYFDAVGLSVDLVLCSPARRARETWDGVAPGLHDNPVVRFEPAIYEATADELLELVRNVDPDVDRLLLVGHNPGVERLATTLAGDGDPSALASLRDGYPTGGFATLTFDRPWSQVRAGSGRLIGLVRPRELGD